LTSRLDLDLSVAVGRGPDSSADPSVADPFRASILSASAEDGDRSCVDADAGGNKDREEPRARDAEEDVMESECATAWRNERRFTKFEVVLLSPALSVAASGEEPIN
jgi:hypothetical protein